MSPVRASSGGLLVLGSSRTESLSVTGKVQSSEWFSSTVNTQVKLDGKEITLKMEPRQKERIAGRHRYGWGDKDPDW